MKASSSTHARRIRRQTAWALGLAPGLLLLGCASGMEQTAASTDPSPRAASPAPGASSDAASPLPLGPAPAPTPAADGGAPGPTTLDASTSPLPLGASCTDDAQCSGGSLGVERVCSTASGTCIAACHSDADCPAPQSCLTGATWQCGTPPADAGGAGGVIVAGYDPAAAVAYAESSWSDGVGECAQFVSDAAVTAGNLSIGYTTWVPTLYTELANASVAYDEYTPAATSVAGCPGDIVIYSNGAGAEFCLPSSTTVPEQNCGHTGVVVGGGSSAGAILADFHNNAHHQLALTGILTGTAVSSMAADYSTFRLYHLSHCAYF